MKLIKWNLHEDVEAYTTTRKLGDISLNNPNKDNASYRFFLYKIEL